MCNHGPMPFHFKLVSSLFGEAVAKVSLYPQKIINY